MHMSINSQGKMRTTRWQKKVKRLSFMAPIYFYRNDCEVAPTLLERMMLSSVWNSSKPGAEDKTLGRNKVHL